MFTCNFLIPSSIQRTWCCCLEKASSFSRVAFLGHGTLTQDKCCVRGAILFQSGVRIKYISYSPLLTKQIKSWQRNKAWDRRVYVLSCLPSDQVFADYSMFRFGNLILPGIKKIRTSLKLSNLLLLKLQIGWFTLENISTRIDVFSSSSIEDASSSGLFREAWYTFIR